MRTVVVSGSAGSGTSSVASALAVRTAGQGGRVALLRSDRLAPGLPDAPPGLRVIDIDPLAWAQSTWQSAGLLRRFAGPPWSSVGGQEILPLPGLAEVAWWGRLREVWRQEYELVVVDAGPVDSAQRWLTLPDTIGGTLRRTWPLAQRTAAAAGGMEAGSWHVRALARLDGEAADLADRLRSASVSVHLVARPNRHELARVLHALAPLSLFELAVTDIVLNHASPGTVAVAEQVAAQLPSMRVRTAAVRESPPNPTAFADEIYPEALPKRKPQRPRVQRRDSGYLWRWHLPMADPAAVSAVTTGEDAVLTVAGMRRVVQLPSVLRRCELRGIDIGRGSLDLRFAPNPDLWPETWELQ